MQSICFENRTFPGLFALGAARSLAGARCAEGTLCHISHSISPAVPLSLTLEEPSWAAALWDRTRLCWGPRAPSPTRAPRHSALPIPVGRTGKDLEELTVNVGISHSFWACFWIQLEFPHWAAQDDFFYLSKHSLQYSVWLGHKVEGRWGQKEGKHGLNAQQAQARGRGWCGQLSWSSPGVQAVGLSLCCPHTTGSACSPPGADSRNCALTGVRQPSAAEGSCSGEGELTPEPLQKLAVACGTSQEGPAPLPRRAGVVAATQSWLFAAGTMMADPGMTRWCTLRFRTPKIFLKVSLKEMLLHSWIKARTWSAGNTHVHFNMQEH